MKKVSIVIPFYNGIKFIDKCIKSLLQQDYKNIEIILVNDGSTDNTLKLLKKYEKKYSNTIKVINQKNSGQSMARNNGLKSSSGYYITFVDQDDYVKKDFISQMVKGIKKADILISGFNRVGDNNKIYQENIPIVCEWSKYKYCATWGKLYKKRFLIKNNILFRKFNIGEDVIFLMNALSYTNNVEIISYAGYNNYRNISSISRTINKEKNTRIKMIYMMDKIEEVINTEYFDIDLLLYFYLKTSVIHLFLNRHVLSMKELYQEYKKYFNWLKKTNEKYNRNKLKINFQFGEEFRLNLIVNLFLISHKLHLSYIFLSVLKLIKPQTIE